MSDVSNVAIVGSGIIGSSWALVFARVGLKVRIWERGKQGATLGRIETVMRNLKGAGLEGDENALRQIKAFTSLEEALDGADYVQESIVENADAKGIVLKDIEAHVGASAIIASSTSGLLPSNLSAHLSQPERLLVVHPLTPPHLLPIVEVCPSTKTSPSTVSATLELMKRVGQRPMLLKKEIAGFALNRVLGAIMNEFFALIRDGVISPDDVDAALTEGFGLRWSVIGPLAAMDLNAPGGARDYLMRYGGIFKEVARSRGAESALSDEVVDEIASAVETLCGGQDRATRGARRDRAIAEVRRLKGDLNRA
jgi:3-hydroxyacyl-CoA dehydrogenase